MDADALLLFDSCQAVPQAFDSRGKGVASAITATGWIQAAQYIQAFDRSSTTSGYPTSIAEADTISKTSYS